VHHRLAQPLKLQLFQVRKLVDQGREDVEVHEGRRAVGRAVLAKLDGAHLAAQVALADRLDLKEPGKRDAEKQLVKALPKMAEAASSPQLKRAFEDHLQQTKGHVTRLEEVFRHLSHSPKAKNCKAMEGLVEEGSELIAAKAEPEVRDAGLIAAAQKVEHYEITGYGSLSS